MRANIRPYDQAVELMTPASTLVAERDGEMVGLAIGGVLDIEFAAGKAAQHAFEREHFEGHTHRATQEEFLTAIRSTRPSLSEEILQAFEDDAAGTRGTESHGRVNASRAACAAARA